MVTPVETWSALIGILVLLKQQIVTLDPDSVQPYRLPRVGASFRSTPIDLSLDPSHRNLLTAANGWPDVNLSLQLMGVDDLIAGPLHETALMRLDMYLGQPLEGWVAEDVYPFAVSDLDRDLVVIGRPGSKRAGQVAWLDGGVVEAYNDLEDWFRTVIGLHQEEVHELQGATT